jgi:hypothetical protein
MQPTVTIENETGIERKDGDSRVERAKGAAHLGTLLLAGWLIAALVRGMYPGGGISQAPTLGGPAFGLWLCAMWATISVYRLLDAGKTRMGVKDWIRNVALSVGAAFLWAIVYSGQWMLANG